MNDSDREYRRTLREARQALRQMGGSLEQIQRNIAAICKRASVFEDKLKKNVVKTLNIRYQPGSGFRSDPIGIEEGKAHFEVALPRAEQSYKFSPQSYEIGAAKVEVIDLRVTQWGVIAALRVCNNDPSFQMPLNWIKPRNRADSAIFLFDKPRREYYFPIWSDLTGQLLPNAPRIGLVLFEPFRMPTPKLLLYLRGARFTAQAFEPELIFRLESLELCKEIGDILALECLADRLRHKFENRATELNAKAATVTNVVSARVSRLENRRSSGCLVFLILVALVGYLVVKF